MSQPDLGPVAATAADVAAEWGVVLGDPFALARFLGVCEREAAVLKKLVGGTSSSLSRIRFTLGARPTKWLNRR